MATRKCKNTGKIIKVFFKVDNADYNKIRKYKWGISPDGYIRATISPYDRIYIHNFLLNHKGIDHINNNPLDNRRCNLRKATPSQNIANSNKRAGCTSRYKGVRYDGSGKRIKRWMAQYEYKNKSHTIGRYNTELEAKEAYNYVAKKVWGEFAKINK